jgi:hypothetical protein
MGLLTLRSSEYRNFKRYFATVLGDCGHREARSPTAAARTTPSGCSGEVARIAYFLPVPSIIFFLSSLASS